MSAALGTRATTDYLEVSGDTPPILGGIWADEHGRRAPTC